MNSFKCILYSIHEKNVVKIQRIFANLIWEVVYTFSPYLNYRIGAAVLQSCASDDLKPSGLLPPHSTVRLWAAFARCETMLGLALEDRSMPIAMPVE